MHVVFVVDNIPNTAQGGGVLTAWSLIKILLDAGHRVTACLLLSGVRTPADHRRLEALAQLGAQTLPVSLEALDGSASSPRTWRQRLMRLGRFLQPTVGDYYPWIAYGPQLERLLQGLRPDLVLTYHWLATAAMYQVRVAPRMAAVGDPDFLASRSRTKLPETLASRKRMTSSLGGRLRAAIKARVDWSQHPKRFLQLLSAYEGVGLFAAHHAQWVQRSGLPRCLYLRTPIPDSAGSAWRDRRTTGAARNKPKILMIGHLKGTATLAGLDLFAREILPGLEDELGPEGFEVHLIGDHDAPAELAQRLARPSIRLRGHLERADEEFLSSDVLLVPTPIALGIRVRILVGWSFGCCVVAHQANALGIPEMRDGHNALLASNGRGLTQAILRVLRDPGLRDRLGANGRQTYEEHFHVDAVGRQIIAELEQIAQAAARRGAIATGPKPWRADEELARAI